MALNKSFSFLIYMYYWVKKRLDGIRRNNDIMALCIGFSGIDGDVFGTHHFCALWHNEFRKLQMDRMIYRYLRTIMPYIWHETCDFFNSVYIADSLCYTYPYTDLFHGDKNENEKQNLSSKIYLTHDFICM